MRFGYILKAAPAFGMSVALLVAVNSVALVDDLAKNSSPARHGYVQCVVGKNPPPVPVYELPCSRKPAAEVQCGEAVVVTSREGPWLKITGADGNDRFIGFLSVSLSNKKFQPVDLPPGPDPDMRACVASLKPPEAPPDTHRPWAIHQVDPDFPEDGRRSGISGSVVLSLTVGTDGLPHDIEVKKSLGHGFDENAILSVQQWRFEPAAEDGRPVPAQIFVEVDFNLAKK
jgi:TonB family protein